MRKSTMKAVLIHQHGDVDALQIGEIAMPEIGAYDVLVKLRTAALNHLDLWVRKGIPGIKPPLPHILGSDGAGEVVQIGTGVTRCKVGDEVVINPSISCGKCPYCLSGEQSLCLKLRLTGENCSGTFAEYISVPEINIYPRPQNLSWEESAAFPLVFVTAWRMLITRAQLKPGECVLIPGIGGGVATAALAICRFLGCEVIVTSSSEEKLAKARQMGAALGINYRQADVAAEVRKWTQGRGVNVVCDSVGGDTWRINIACLTKNGRLVTCGATTGANPATDIPRIFWNQLTIIGSTMGSHRDFAEMHRVLSRNDLRPVVDSVYAFTEIKAAQQYMEQKQQFGKIVLHITS